VEHATLISDLATASVMAGAAAVVFHLLRLPLMLGYLLCGLLVGPHIQSVFSIYNEQAMGDLSHLGVIFLMFYIGLEFDVTKLQKLLPSTLLALVFQCVSMIFIGLFIAPVLGWTSISGLFLGGILAISSTMITISIVREQGGLKKDYAQSAIGILILEDIVAIIMLVILSGVGLTGKLALNAIWQVSLLVGVFVVMIFFVGRIISPYLLRLVDKTGNAEVLTLVTVGFVLGIAQFAEVFHFSTELGAFMAGSILSQSRLSEAIEHAIEPLRNLFTAIFFVTIGMLIQPRLILEYWKIIVLLTFLVIAVKTLTCWLGLYLSGLSSRVAFKAALCKAHIGEFSFVIASLGQSLKVADSSLMAVAVGVSLGTIVVVPILAKNGDKLFSFGLSRTPRLLKEAGELYHTLLGSIKDQFGRYAIVMLIRRPMLQALAYFLIFHGVILIGSFASKSAKNFVFLSHYQGASQLGVWVLTGLVGVPFLFAVIRNINACLMLLTEAVLPTYEKSLFIRSSLRNVLNAAVLTVVLIVFSGSYLSAVAKYLPTGSVFIIFIGLILLCGFFFWRKIITINSQMERLFIQSFKQHRQSQEEQKHKKLLENLLKKHPWNIYIQEHLIGNHTWPCGKRISELKLRESSGSSIIALTRSGYTVYDPSPETAVFPQDRLVLLGNKEQNTMAERLLGKKAPATPEGEAYQAIKVQQIILGKSSSLIGESLASSKIRQHYAINVVGIQRGEKRISNPSAQEEFFENDILVVVGNKEGIDRFKAAISPEAKIG
jgi:monovalent cation:H+ antiporter-2, CPA2 family